MWVTEVGMHADLIDRLVSSSAAALHSRRCTEALNSERPCGFETR
jgi:hypothetical protein